MPAPRLLLPLGACALALLPAGAAADTGKCDGPSLTASSAFSQRFPRLLEQARSELPRLHGIDACAQVDLQLGEQGARLSVLLPDGRATEREVARAEDVLPSLQALLLVPEPAAPTEIEPAARLETPLPAKRPAKRALPRPRTARPPASSQQRSADTAPVPASASENGFEISVVTGVRAGDGQYGYGGGVLSFIQLSRWLIGFHGRADGYRALLGSDPETALALGLLLGRRFALGSTTLDLTAGPALALRGATFAEVTEVAHTEQMAAPVTSGPPPEPRERDIGPVPRLLLGARWGFSPRSVFRTFIGLDGELGPRRSDYAAEGFGVSGRMPAYTLGLSLGATLGTR